MTATAKPNSWVAVEETETQLTYAPCVNPAPLTTSDPARAATLGSLVVAISNDKRQPLSIDSVTFVVIVGKPGTHGAPLTPSIEGVRTEVSSNLWSFQGPPAGFTEGRAEFILKPEGGNGTLAPGESLLVEIADFPTVETANASTVKVIEVVETAAETSFVIPTFPAGFFFDSLVVTVEEGGKYRPVAQVERGSKVALLWSTSEPLEHQQVHYSNAAEGEKTEPPQTPGGWTSPQLTADTVFVVSVEVPGPEGTKLPAALATSVAVKDPALIAASATVAGALEAGSAKVNGQLEAAGAKLGGALEAGSAKVNGTLAAGNTKVGQLEAAGAQISGSIGTGALTANSAEVGELTTSQLLRARGGVHLFSSFEELRPGKWLFMSDGILIYGKERAWPVTGYTWIEIDSGWGNSWVITLGTIKPTPYTGEGAEADVPQHPAPPGP